MIDRLKTGVPAMTCDPGAVCVLTPEEMPGALAVLRGFFPDETFTFSFVPEDNRYAVGILAGQDW